MGSGRAGWGVWCLRMVSEPEDEDGGGGCGSGKGGGGDGDGDGGENGSEVNGLGLRIYCWGEVVGHIYLLLYLVSERKIKGTDAKWVDGGGEVVVVMP